MAQNERLGLLVPIFMLGVILMFFIPLPTFLLDTFQALNITISVTVFLLSMYTKEALDFSIFPTLLLVTTLFRLALNVSSTKLILSLGTAFNGKVVRSFGNFVVGGNYIIGIILFLILVIIQFMVITKGSERVAEVAARFTLDAMPGKQMSIDADYNAGLITEDEARDRRKKVQTEADFYGAMDGASKFVKGDAIAGIIITFINVIGGLIIGVITRGEPIVDAAATYTILTIGDGLASQIPALLISVATGIIVTRTTSEADFGSDLIRQFFQEPRILYMVSGVLVVMGIIPGMPKVPFFILSLSFGTIGYIMNKNILEAEKIAVEEKRSSESNEEMSQPEEVKDLLKVDEMELELGYSLIPIVDTSQGGDLLERITIIRKQLAIELGIILPPIRIRDNMQLNPNEYSIKIKGTAVTKGEIMIGYYLAMNPGGAEEINGIPTVEPAFGLPAIWIGEEQREKAEMIGYTVVDPTSVLATHLTETIKKYAPEILSREMVKELIENIKTEYSVVVDEVYPKKFELGEIQTVLQNLLNEGVSIRNLQLILEIMADASKITTNVDILSEYVRSGLSRQICSTIVAPDDKIHVVTLNPNLEIELKENIQETDFGSYLNIDPEKSNKIIVKISEEAKNSTNMGYQPIVLTSPEIRKPLRRLIERDLKQVMVISYNEIISEIDLEAVGMVSVE
ncbi:flagellar biosynthesis protein FlhA [Haliovirga abyssi]|uniref:Flagellar biosynthesis protein FlhA n=1 Tax=Haliovirga abyssi TaxID=2996794 RepID=A0AAU9DD76_9FUSO|nr:flagellar biosynthesis protein FlhA [Haliovirga abyssi]BDU50123.1 flagellar biosynthesis protein FlhA [Haliovirga abyssi]